MKTFARHHLDTPFGESHAPISISILLTMMFVGVQWLVRILIAVATPIGSPSTLYAEGSPFRIASLIIAVLLLLFMAVDLHRNRLEAHGGKRYQYAVFAVAAVVVVEFLWFLQIARALTGATS